MDHVVFFSDASGEPAFRRVAELEEAVRLVESLRNEQGIADVEVHELTEVPVSFRTYYRVEIGGVAPPAPEPVVVTPVPNESVPTLDSTPVHVADETVAAVGWSEEADLTSEEVTPSLEVETPELVADPGADPVAGVATEATTDDTEITEGDAEDIGVAYAAEADEQPLAPADEDFSGFTSFAPLVPLTRPEVEPERSIGYFAH